MSFYVAHPPGFTKKRAERSINIVLLGDGFFPHREAVFLMHVDSFAQRLLRTAPFNRFHDHLTVSCIFRGAKVSLAHLKPGQECDWRNQRPNGQPPPDDYEFGTPYGALFCRTRNAAGEAERESLWGNKNKVWADVAAEPSLVGLVCFPLVLVDNDQLSGGNKGGFTKPALPFGQLPDVGWLSIDPGWRLTAMHELGHSAFGLADEYDSGTGRYTGADPASPNITTVNTRQKLIDQWRATPHKRSLRVWHSLMKPSTPAPTAINPGCVAQHEQEPVIVVPKGETGLYEGALHSPCGVFRPNLECMMRDHRRHPKFCPVCEWAIEEKFAATINPLHVGQTVPLAPPAVGLWTHMWIHHEVKPDHQGNVKSRPLYGFYNQSGRYAVRPASTTAGGDLEAEVTAPNTFIPNGQGWSTMLPCEISSDTCLIAHSISFQRLAIYRLMDAPGNLRVLTETFDSGVGGYPFTHAATFFSKGQLHLLGYHALTGAIDIAHVAKNSVRPVTVFGTLLDATRLWPTGFTHVTTMFVDNVPFVLRHNAPKGDVELESLDPPGAGPVPFVRTGHWNPGATSVTAYVSAGRTYVCRSSIGQYRAFDRVWPGGRGIEALSREQRADLTFALAPIQYLPTESPFEALVALNGGTELQFLNVKR